MTRLIVVGDALLDRDLEGAVERLCPDAPVPVLDRADTCTRPGGAALAAALAARDGHEVVLVTALGSDARGAELALLLEHSGVEVVDVGLDGATPEKLRVRAAGRTLLRIDSDGAGRPREAGAAARAAIAWAPAVLVADYGRGMAAAPGVRAALGDAAARGRPLIWDPHPRGASPLPGTTLSTPNESEARCLAQALVAPPGPAGAEDCGRALARAWGARHVAVTCGAAGAVMVQADAGPALAVPAATLVVGDPCGAGDRFSAAAAASLAGGATPAEAVTRAVPAATAFVCAGGAAAALRQPEADPVAAGADGLATVERLRSEGGTVVATGGCFDLLHVGHVQSLEAARRLGDCLVVCLNGDASVRRLKGPHRPVVPAHDRAAVLAALSCVDAVAIFDEDTPERILAELRPDVWAKGGEYAGEAMPEADVVRRWGGRAVVLPYLDGRSTSGLIDEAVLRAGA
jgi:D-beta-D-heptose 7-phosphate kinase / D-beta-D-heptose 1-phosphate adenosyltransferase